MSSPSPIPNMSGSSRDAISLLTQPSRRISLMNNLQSGGGLNNRSISPPSAQQQTSPNSSFLAGLSSRLVSNPTSRGGGLGSGQLQQQPSQQQPIQYPNMNSNLSRSGLGIADIFDSAAQMGTGGGSGFSGFRGTGLNNFGIPTTIGPPSTLDFNEFPSLGGAGGGHTLSGGNAPGSNRPNYVGQVVKDIVPSNHDYAKSTFNMDEMDFPALPGSQAGHRDANDPNSFTGFGVSGSFTTSITQQSANQGHGLGDGISNSVSKSGKRGIQTTKEGRVTNIPMGMVTDQFGMIGLLTFIRAAETDQSLVSLALGTDLTTLKLDLNSPENLYSSFSGPWSDQPLRPFEIDYSVPSEYLIYNQIRDKLAPIKLARYGDDTLFFLFYMFPSDLIQIAAASEL